MAQQQLKELEYDGKKVVVEVAKRDGSGNVITTTYATKTEVGNLGWTDIGSKPFASLDSDHFSVSDTVLSLNTTNIPTKTFVANNYLQTSVYDAFVATIKTVATTGSYTDLTNKPTIPADTSDLTNNAGFITKNVADLTNYYTKTEIDASLSGINQFQYVTESTLPTASASTMYKIYLIPSSNSVSQNAKDEFITIRSGAGTEADPYTYSWEQIGTTTVDLSNYVTLNGNQAITGTKTFSGSTGSAPHVYDVQTVVAPTGLSIAYAPRGGGNSNTMSLTGNAITLGVGSSTTQFTFGTTAGELAVTSQIPPITATDVTLNW